MTTINKTVDLSVTKVLALIISVLLTKDVTVVCLLRLGISHM